MKPEPQTQAKSWRIRFGIRSLLVLVTAAAPLLTLWTMPAIQQQKAVGVFEELGLDVNYSRRWWVPGFLSNKFPNFFCSLREVAGKRIEKQYISTATSINMPQGFSNPAISRYLPNVHWVKANHPFDPNVLKDLAKLEYLCLRTDELKIGYFPDLPQVENLLVLTGNRNVDFDAFQHFPNLGHLSIPSRELHTASFAKFAQSTRLEHLSVWESNVRKEDLTPIGDLNSLRILNLLLIDPPDLSPLTACDNLETVHIRLSGANGKEINLSPLGEISSLKEVSLDGTIGRAHYRKDRNWALFRIRLCDQ